MFRCTLSIIIHKRFKKRIFEVDSNRSLESFNGFFLNFLNDLKNLWLKESEILAIKNENNIPNEIKVKEKFIKITKNSWFYCFLVWLFIHFIVLVAYFKI
jgi:hypothetical protein